MNTIGAGRRQLSFLERRTAYRGFRYSEMIEKRRAGTNTSCPSYKGVLLTEVSFKREDPLYIHVQEVKATFTRQTNFGKLKLVCLNDTMTVNIHVIRLANC